ncbi:MAG: carboxypeptidase-like regulatory domain-containing protein [Acidobacteriia bacterium]|nr:carboxypeptidase-like regulatory domain-containing protein [Terriglobia bacterium]
MKKIAFRMVMALLLIASVSALCHAQVATSSSLVGTVKDQSGGFIPGADVLVKNNNTGAEYKAVTGEDGVFHIPALSPGTYTATVTVPNFKQAIVKDIVLTAGNPGAITVTLQVGGTNEVVTVQANAEIVQSQTATITTTMNVSQISSLPLSTRSALDFLVNLPGVNTTSSARNATVMGLPNATINITIDGTNTQDNYLKGSIGGDGMFSMIMPRIDSVEEMTVSTATPGSESSGQGAVQIKFVTRSGNNDYHGSFYEYHQNSWLNANTWANNRDKAPAYNGTGVPCTAAQMANEFDKCKAARNKLILNQYGGRFGGPISVPKWLFGPLGFSGKDRAFFFVNYEELRQPAQVTRTRTIFNPLVDQGIFPYTVGSTVQQVNLFTLAAANGQTATWDPTIQKLLGDIRNVSQQIGSTKQQTNPALMDYVFVNRAPSKRKSPVVRGDFNITSKQRVELSWYFNQYPQTVDITNSVDPAYPTFPNFGTQGGNRFSGSVALRSTLTPRIVNEARFGFIGGGTLFWPDVNAGQFATSGIGNQDGFALSLSPISNAYIANGPERRNTPNESINDTLSWSKGSHNISIGGSFTNVALWIQDFTYTVPSISFGVNTSYDPARFMFDATNGPKNFQGSSPTQYTQAQQIYALMTGRVTAINGNAYLNEASNQYAYNGDFTRRGHMREIGAFVSDSWRLRPGFTLNYGVRWEGQLPFVPLNNVYTFNTIQDLWGLSGVGNLFKPGTLTGTAPTYKQYVAGSPAYNTSYKGFAPSVGFAWTPKGEGFLKRIMGDSGQTVLRGGFSLAYNRNGMYEYDTMFSGNVGPSISATRNVNNGNLVSGVGSDTWPLLFSQKSRLGPPSFPTTPTYPLSGSSPSDQVNVFDPGLKIPYTLSWSFGVQREITKDMVIEVRYAASRNLQAWNYRNLNETVLVENGFLSEFKLAMANLKANQAAGKGNTFAYTGAAGTSPLPITLAYFSGISASQAGDTTKYNSSNFGSSTFTTYLAQFNPNPGSYASALYGNATYRTNATNAGLPVNEFQVNPTVSSGGAYIMTNGGRNYYDSMVVELRRRLSRGLLVQASYVWAKNLDLNRVSFRSDYVKTIGTTLPHTFKVNWIYELPLGSGKMLLGGSHGVLDRVIGGWQFMGVSRWQSGTRLALGNVRLVGMTLDDVRNLAGLRFDDVNRQLYYFPADVIANTIAAYNVSATSSTGYSPAYGVPTGRYFAPANSNYSVDGCLQVVTGDCAPYSNYIRGPRFINFDLSLVKQIRFTESKNFEIRAEMLNAFNYVTFNAAMCASSSASCGQFSGTQSGPRNIQAVLRFNF